VCQGTGLNRVGCCQKKEEEKRQGKGGVQEKRPEKGGVHKRGYIFLMEVTDHQINH